MIQICNMLTFAGRQNANTLDVPIRQRFQKNNIQCLRFIINPVSKFAFNILIFSDLDLFDLISTDQLEHIPKFH